MGAFEVSGFCCFGVLDLGFPGPGLGVRFLVSAFMVWGFGLGVQGSRFGVFGLRRCASVVGFCPGVLCGLGLFGVP